MSSATVEVRNALWPQGEALLPPDEDEGAAYWRDAEGRPFALSEVLAGADEPTADRLRRRHCESITILLEGALQAPSGRGRELRHRACRLIGEMDGWWTVHAREAREWA